MQLEVQWFIQALVDNNLTTITSAEEINRQLSGDPDLMTYAQACLDSFCANASENEAKEWASQFEKVMAYAQQQAATGALPPVFSASDAAEAPAGQTAAPPEAPPQPPAEIKPVTFDPSTLPPITSYDITEMPDIRQVSAMTDEQVAVTMRNLLLFMRAYGASDLHISANSPLFIRRELLIQRPDPEWVIPAADAVRLNEMLLTQEQRDYFHKAQDMRYGLQIGKARFRTSLMYQKDGVSGSYHLVPDRILSLEELGFLPKDAVNIRRLLDYTNGLILVTGPIGSGKTTTLASMVDVANCNREDHVIMVEDPIEIVEYSKKCQITQREVGRCTNSYHAALKGALREDPDIIVIGEMHDLETIENAITAAETGHLVIGTLHTCDAGNTLNRVLDVFPPQQQTQIRTMTAGSLRGVICQRLVPAAAGGLTIAYEIMINTMAISNLISEGKIFQLKASIEIGSKAGMCTLDQNLLEKYREGLITYETALSYMKDTSVIDQIRKMYAVQQAQMLAAANPRLKKR